MMRIRGRLHRVCGNTHIAISAVLEADGAGDARCELTMGLALPALCILDEMDSGLDIDALRIAADGVNALRSPDRAIVVITHYQGLLNYIIPDFVRAVPGVRMEDFADQRSHGLSA
jgi:hypothetical protein